MFCFWLYSVMMYTYVMIWYLSILSGMVFCFQLPLLNLCKRILPLKILTIPWDPILPWSSVGMKWTRGTVPWACISKAKEVLMTRVISVHFTMPHGSCEGSWNLKVGPATFTDLLRNCLHLLGNFVALEYDHYLCQAMLIWQGLANFTKALQSIRKMLFLINSR